MLLQSLAARKREISTTKAKSVLVPASADLRKPQIANSTQSKEKSENPKKKKSCKSDLRPHKASVCPHMFVCLFSSRIWSTCGFWAGRMGIIFWPFSGLFGALSDNFFWILEFVLGTLPLYRKFNIEIDIRNNILGRRLLNQNLWIHAVCLKSSKI